MKKPRIKVGDLVHTTKNGPWGLKAMTVKMVGVDYVHCKHPDFKEIGFFPISHLVKFKKARENQLEILRKLKDAYEMAAKKLFR